MVKPDDMVDQSDTLWVCYQMNWFRRRVLSNTHEMTFTTKHESDVVGIRRGVAKRPRKLWIVVATPLRIPLLPNYT